MHTFYKSLHLKKTLFLAMACLLSVGVQKAYAQYSGIVGTITGPSATTFPNPFPENWEAARQQYLYQASELRSAGIMPGVITAIAFYNQSSGGMNIEGFQINMGQTTSSALASTSWEPTPTQVFGPATVTGSVNWTTLTFSTATPFYWDGTSNLVVNICQANTKNNSPLGSMAYMTTSFNSSHSIAQNNGGSGCNASGLTDQGNMTRRPVTRFSYKPNCEVPEKLTITDVDYKSARFQFDTSKTPQSALLSYRWLVSQSRIPPAPSATNFILPNSPLERTLQNLTPETKYYVHLITHCNLVPGQKTVNEYSGWILDSFTTQADCAMPNVTVDQITHKSAVASWPPVPTAYDYEYAVSISPTPPTSGIHTQSTFVLLQGLLPERSYYVFVRSYCSPTPMSRRWDSEYFITGFSLSIDETDADGFSLKSYPNPVKDRFTMEVEKAAANATVHITDITGKVVRMSQINNNNATVDMSDMPAGMYIIRYKDDVRSKTLKFTKQ